MSSNNSSSSSDNNEQRSDIELSSSSNDEYSSEEEEEEKEISETADRDLFVAVTRNDASGARLASSTKWRQCGLLQRSLSHDTLDVSLLPRI